MLSWWGQRDRPLKRDSQGVNTDLLVPAVLDAAADAGMRVSWHVEPYGDRSPQSVLEDMNYLHAQYGGHRAIWRHGERQLPLVFLYDVSFEHSGSGEEYQRTVNDWKTALAKLRGGPADAILLSLYHDKRDIGFVHSTGFDGAYTYFAAEGFTEGSTLAHWATAQRELRASGKLFVPSVGPGYLDTGIRPWNHANTKERQRGAYYDKMWQAALDLEPFAVTITSYNEWGEGTQIEPARPHTTRGGTRYEDYGEDGPDFYMERTRWWTAKAKRQCGSMTKKGEAPHVAAPRMVVASSPDEL